VLRRKAENMPVTQRVPRGFSVAANYRGQRGFSIAASKWLRVTSA
jgi:hypothetical protein